MADKYKRQMTEEELREEMLERGEIDEDGNLVEIEEEPEPIVPREDNVDWKKRYDDGRRFQIQLQTQNKELEHRLTETEKKLSESMTVPDNIEEFEEWVKEFPKVYDMMKIVARQEASSLDENIKTKLSKLDELDQKEKMKVERAKLAQLQPDFYDKILPTQEFKDWIRDVAPQWAKDAIRDEKNPNAELVSMVIDSYKVRSGYGAPKKPDQKTTSQEAASRVQTRNRTAPNDKQTSTWSESRVERLSDAEFDKYEGEIAAAMSDGTFVYDIRDAQ